MLGRFESRVYAISMKDAEGGQSGAERKEDDDGLTDAAVAAGTASDDRKWVEFVQANLIIRLL